MRVANESPETLVHAEKDFEELFVYETEKVEELLFRQFFVSGESVYCEVSVSVVQ